MATEQTQLKASNVQETLANLGQNKRMVVVGAAVVTVVIAIIIVAFAWSRGTSKGNEIDLVKRIDQSRAFEIVSKLKIGGIEAKVADSELPGKVNIKVFQKDFDESALTLARSDLLQEDGFNLFDKSDWAASDYDKRIKMMRAVNGDLSRIVSRMSGIKWSTVRVNIPEPQLFSQYQAPTTATVQIELPEEGVKLSRAQVRSIINLLVGYVPNLQRNNISIIDTNGESYSAVETEEVAASEVLEETERVNKMIEKRIGEYLEPLLGTSNYIVRVSSEISRRKIEESATTFGEGVVGQEQIGDERLGASQTEVAGAAGPAVPGLDSSKGYARTNKTVQRYPSFKQKTVSTPPGRISRITVAVAINRDLVPRVSIKQIREGIAAITSPNTTVDDVKINVAEFARDRIRTVKAQRPSISLPNIGGTIQEVAGNLRRIPIWLSITIAVFGLLIILGSMKGRAVRPVESESTMSQISQAAVQRQFQRPEAQIPAGGTPQAPEALAQEPDFTGILTGLKDAAAEQPEYLASKLQIWLEEGTPVGRT